MSIPDDLAPLVAQEFGRGLVIARKRFLTAITDKAFPAACIARFRAGEEQYGYKREWLSWPGWTFEAEGFQEIQDAALYPTMELVAEIVRRHG